MKQMMTAIIISGNAGHSIAPGKTRDKNDVSTRPRMKYTYLDTGIESRIETTFSQNFLMRSFIIFTL